MEDFVHAIIAGIIQGATEFLPVSSSGHLVLFQRFTSGFAPEDLFMDIMLHLGTLVAVVIFTRHEVMMLCRATLQIFSAADTTRKRRERKLLLAVIIAGIPTALFGFLIKWTIVEEFSNLYLLGTTFAITTVLLIWSRWLGGDRRTVNSKTALAVGIAQGLSVLPGISRSGSTIIIGQAMGLGRRTSARFAFVLSIPAIIGAALFSIFDISNLPNFNTAVLFPILCGMIAAAFVGYICLMMLALIVKKARLHYFAFYTGAVSIFCFLQAVIG